MKSFLEYVAEDIIRKYGTDLSRTAIVFPNKRASLFLNEHLARLAGHPLWSPAYITISELFRQQTTRQVADPIKLVCDLHQSFCQETGSTETLDKFYGWGQLLISDFDDIDKNMADADRVFANLRDIHELDDLSFLTEEQRQLLRHFFSHFTEEHETELKQRFLNLWSHFADIYHDFNERLAKQGLAYEGALYRQVCCHAMTTNITSAFPYDRYLFVGFNLLQKVEQQLFSFLQKEGKAKFYWDFDHYYMQHHEAGRYIARYLEYFPNELDNTDADIYRQFSQPKQIRYMSAPTQHIQARYVSSWLREAERYKDGRRTAIVLCDESLLPTVIHCLPNEVEKINVTTGYPLALTPVASFIQLYYNYQLGGRSPRLLRAFKRHPYTRFLEVSEEGQEVRDLPEANGDLIGQLLSFLRQIATKAKDEIQDPLFQESLFRAYTLINRLDGLMESGDLQVTDQTLQRLTTQIMQQTSIPFHGEPAEGLQVMGVLETRNLDFDHVLLLSCNEGNMPKGVNDSSFIPHSIRQAYELTTVENKVSIYAYYFHRLIQRASDVTILYNNSTEDGQRGEMSRFMLQLMVESGQHITLHALQAGKQIERWTPRPIEKSDHVLQILKSSFERISPTAISKYMRCPLQFYYRYVAGLQEPDIPDDEQELDNRMFGDIFHDAADIIYHRLPRHITKDVLDHLLKTKVEIERAVDEAFHNKLPNSPLSGLHIINREVIIHYLRQLLEIDRRLAPFTILGLECDVYRPLTSTIQIGGRIDRLDLIHEDTPLERIRVVDYKTGSRNIKPLPDVESIFSPEKIHEHSDYYLQACLYADIVSGKQNILPQTSALRHQPSDVSPQTSALRHQPSDVSPLKVSPALLFIQHAAADDYDPTLKFGKEPILDIADHSARFNELLNEKVDEIFSSTMPFCATDDLKVCRTCPYAPLCRR